MERLAQFGMHTVQYEEGLAVARRIRASRYLGAYHNELLVIEDVINSISCVECSAKHNRGVTEVFYEAARVSISARAKGSSSSCVIM
jgi:Rho family protein